MPRQNRVQPNGELIRTPERGALMGNRGCLHDSDGNIVRKSALKRWIYCKLSYRGIRRQIMRPGSYTELFFLDEVTALSAGHRPCGECNRTQLQAFRLCFPIPNCGLTQIDEILHRERMGAPGPVRLDDDLPSGVMLCDTDGHFFLWDASQLWQWSFAGYAASLSKLDELRVVTPNSMISVLRAGFSPNCQLRPQKTNR